MPPPPQARSTSPCAQEAGRREEGKRIGKRIGAFAVVEGCGEVAVEPVVQQGTEVRRVGRDPLGDAQPSGAGRPTGCHASRPARDQEQPAIDRRIPERHGHEPIGQHQRHLQYRPVTPQHGRAHAVRRQHGASQDQHDKLHGERDGKDDHGQRDERNERLESTVVTLDTGSDFQNNMLRSRRSLYRAPRQ